MSDTPQNTNLAPADDDIAEKFVAFLLRNAEPRKKHDDVYVVSEITAKRVLKGLRRSGFVLMKRKPSQNLGPHQAQMSFL